jgi:rhodanese-related sulfurtransferase
VYWQCYFAVQISLCVIVCHSGSRALQAATSLEMIGFKNAKVLYGGIIALAKSDLTGNVQ